MINLQPVHSFENYMRSQKLAVKGSVINDGLIHRFHVAGDKLGSLNGWYVLHSNEISYGAFGSWRTGFSATWRESYPEFMTVTERKKIETQIAELRKQQKELHLMKQNETAAKAKQMWSSATPANLDHAYIKRKNIKPFHLRQLGNTLIVPLINKELEIRNLQLISPDFS